MTREDYEDQKHRLAEQRRLRVELAESAYQQQMRALDLVWGMMSGEGAADRSAAAPSAPPLPQATAPAAPVRRRLKAGELYNDIVDLLPSLPESFTHAEITAALGYAPDRASLHRDLKELTADGHIAVAVSGMGNRPTQYRWPHRRTAPAEA
jgi:hypothetical protein